MSVDMEDLLARALNEAGERYVAGPPPTDLFMKRYVRRRALKTIAALTVAAAVIVGMALGLNSHGRKIEPIHPTPSPTVTSTGVLLPTNSSSLVQLSGISQNVAWGFTVDKKGGTHLWRTTNGGRTWHLADVNLSWAPGMSSIGAEFPDANKAFVQTSAGDFWFITSDGGTTWRFITLPRRQGPKPTDTYFFGADTTDDWFQALDNQTIFWTVAYGYGPDWICANSAPQQCDGKHKHPNRTVDRIFMLQGKTWAELAPAPFAGPLHFIDRAHVWGITDDHYGVDQSLNRRVFWRSSDGARTWSRSTLPGTLAFLVQPTFPTVQDGFALAIVTPSFKISSVKRERSPIFVIATHDGGATWATTAVLDAPEPMNTFYPEEGSLFATDPSHLLIALGNTIRVSADSGFTFESVPLAQREDAKHHIWTVRSVSFQDLMHGWALVSCQNLGARFLNTPPGCGTYVLLTGDGGQTWRLSKPPG